MRRALLITCAVAYGQDQTCVDDPNWVKNGDEPWKDCAWAAEYLLEYVQTTQFADDAKAEVLALYHLEELMGPYLCDASWSSVYSREPLAEFYRRLQAFNEGFINKIDGRGGR